MKRIQNLLRGRNFVDSNLRILINNKYQKLFSKNDLNICYNKHIQQSYNPKKKNILLAIESPAVVEHNNWISDDMEFIAEISFGNFKKLDNYLCCRDLYVNSDNFIDISVGSIYDKKPGLVSIVSSDKDYLPGHKFRHEIIQHFSSRIQVFGSGYGKFGDITDSYTEYKFQVVIENGRYPEYVSEKFFNCIKTQTIPIYWGGKEAVRKMGFDLNGILFFDTKEKLNDIIDMLSPELYESKKESVLANMHRIIELRNEQKMGLYLNTVMLNYFHTTKSYLSFDFNNLNLLVE